MDGHCLLLWGCKHCNSLKIDRLNLMVWLESVKTSTHQNLVLYIIITIFIMHKIMFIMLDITFVIICNALFYLVDQLFIRIRPLSHTVGERGTVQFNATVRGINMNRFTYQWSKKGSDSLPNKVSGVNGTVLTIPNLLKSDEGRYYCTVTNEWGRSKQSNDVTLIVEGTCYI